MQCERSITDPTVEATMVCVAQATHVNILTGSTPGGMPTRTFRYLCPAHAAQVAPEGSVYPVEAMRSGVPAYLGKGA